MFGGPISRKGRLIPEHVSNIQACLSILVYCVFIWQIKTKCDKKENTTLKKQCEICLFVLRLVLQLASDPTQFSQELLTAGLLSSSPLN